MPFGLGFFATAGVSAAGGSYELIASEILTGSQASVTFSNLGDYASTYQHLQIRGVARISLAQAYGAFSIRVNGDTASNYARHEVGGNGSNMVTNAYSSVSSMQDIVEVAGTNNDSNAFGGFVIDILDPYESKNKTFRALTGRPTSSNPRISLSSGLWNSTASVTSISLHPLSASNFVQYSRFSLYGIKG